MTKQCWQESAEPGKRRTKRRQWPGEPGPTHALYVKEIEDKWEPMPPGKLQVWHQPPKPILLIRGWLGITIATLTHAAALAIGIGVGWLIF